MGGGTWSTVDDFVSDPNGYSTQASTIATDSVGDVYVAGYADGYGWMIRKGVGGQNFTTVDTLPSGGLGASSLFVHPVAGVLAAGQADVVINGKTVRAWVVRRSLDGGATWQSVDTFYGTKPGGAYYFGRANAIGADSLGNIYVAGSLAIPNKSSTSWEWVVRKSSDSGLSWNTVDAFQLSSGYNAGATGFVADSNGNLFVAGNATSGSSWFWLVRENPGGTSTWQTVDAFQYVTGLWSAAAAITADASGHVFVGGSGDDGTTGGPWLVRKH